MSHGRKLNLGSRASLAEPVEVGLNDMSDFWIAADGLPVDPEDDALAVARHLDSTGADGFRNQFPRRHGKSWADQPQAHAIGSGSYSEVRCRECLRETSHAVGLAKRGVYRNWDTT